MHEVAPNEGAKLPVSQGAHAAFPEVEEYVPGAQRSQPVPPGPYVPGPHQVQEDEPGSDPEPGSHGSHRNAAGSEKVPAGQIEHDPAPSDEYVPGAQSVQLVARLPEYVPARQVPVHSSPGPVWYVPGTQSKHAQMTMCVHS
jgi:hypothetical protein